ncbi:hypothetical protein IVA77_16610 [Bradyrhizobium sp. 136]|uniref:hypothetical protein n=1 Tax=Bradyrhizobium sp. 163 TaxID=2782636 RepID=UPI001FF8FE28|nr:hypothetical protein [Bradyrhizobium sp. 163]MCK1763159.1 hypothetical protein [Bradyrhizobium sp. 136]
MFAPRFFSIKCGQIVEANDTQSMKWNRLCFSTRTTNPSPGYGVLKDLRSVVERARDRGETLGMRGHPIGTISLQHHLFQGCAPLDSCSHHTEQRKSISSTFLVPTT